MAEKPYIVVIGAANVDIAGTPDNKIIMGDSNPGKVRLSLGGVARNMAENIAHMSYSVKLITVLGNDIYAENIKKNCEELGIDLQYSLFLSEGSTSSYLCINGEDGNILAAISDMDSCEQLTPSFLFSKQKLMDDAVLVLVDANLPKDSLVHIAEHCCTPIVCDPVSASKAAKVKDILPKLAAIKPSRIEAEVLLDCTIKDDDQLKEATEALVQKGVKNVFISLGEEGTYFSNGIVAGKHACFKGDVVNTSGCGDAFVAAISIGMTHDIPIEEMARLGLAAASICAESEKTVNPEISLKNIKKRMDK